LNEDFNAKFDYNSVPAAFSGVKANVGKVLFLKQSTAKQQLNILGNIRCNKSTQGV
jgi:hypothetical protein